MTIGRRLTLWYAGILMASLVVIGLGTCREIAEQARRGRPHPFPALHALNETSEMVFQVGLPAVVLGVLGGWWLTRRALSPVKKLTADMQKIHAHNLREPLARTGNGDELDQLTAVFNETLARLADAMQRIREFTVHASHELKTPLTVLRGETELALREQPLTPAERERAASQLEELARLTRIVDSLTLLARADAGQLALNFETVNLAELARDNFADLQILAEPREIVAELGACEDVYVRGDRHRLRQLLLNLCDNAVKYNHPGGQVVMSLQRAGGRARFTIANDGPGIPAEILPRVFDRFFRGDPAHQNTIEGCGLGLSIAQWIALAHHGTIQIESVINGRTTVTVTLPISSS